jgi:hypothetical protein
MHSSYACARTPTCTNCLRFLCLQPASCTRLSADRCPPAAPHLRATIQHRACAKMPADARLNPMHVFTRRPLIRQSPLRHAQHLWSITSVPSIASAFAFSSVIQPFPAHNSTFKLRFEVQDLGRGVGAGEVECGDLAMETSGLDLLDVERCCRGVEHPLL